MLEKLTVPGFLMKHAPQYLRDFKEGRIDKAEYDEQRKAYWEARGYVVTDSGLEPKELVDRGIVHVDARGHASIKGVVKEIPTGRAGKFEEVVVPDPRYFQYYEREEARLDAAIRAHTYTEHVAEYYAEEEEAW